MLPTDALDLRASAPMLPADVPDLPMTLPERPLAPRYPEPNRPEDPRPRWKQDG